MYKTSLTATAAVLTLLVVSIGVYAQVSLPYLEVPTRSGPAFIPRNKLPINNVLLEMRDYPRSLWSFLYPASIVDSGKTLYPGDSISTTINVTNLESFAIPDTEYSDGHVVLAYIVSAVYDPDGTVLDSNVDEISNTSVMNPNDVRSVTVSYTAESGDKQGTYYAVASIVTQTWDYDKDSDEWKNTEAYKLVDTQVVKFKVKEIPPFEGPPSGQDIFDIIQDIWNAIWQKILDWLGA